MWIDVIVEIIQVISCGTKACLLGSMFGTCFFAVRVLSSFAIILMRKIELVALLQLSS